MVYKKYVYKRGRRHGPYYYHSYREGNHVKKVYIGGRKEYKEWLKKEEKKEIHKTLSRTPPTFHKPFSAINKKLFLIPIVVLLILIAGFLIYNQLSLVGKVSLEMQDTYVFGENISGSLRLNLKEGELLPLDSKIIIEQDGIISEIILSELLQSNNEGNFYIENQEITGGGQGYGFAGEKISYPTLNFKLKIYDSGEEEPLDEEETEEEIEEEPTEEAEENVTEESEEIIVEEPVEEEIPTEASQETSAEQTQEKSSEKQQPSEKKEEKIKSEASKSDETSESGSESAPEASESTETSSPITGEAVRDTGKVNYVDGSVSKENPFSYTLNEGKTASIKRNSVRTEDNKKLNDDAVTLQISGQEAEVSTDYLISEEGFGLEYIGGEIHYIDISINELGILAQQGTLTIKLVYQDKELAKTSKEIEVVSEIPKKNVTEITNATTNVTIPEVNITIINETLTNLTVSNITIANETIVNITTINETALNITTKQYKAIINRPVKWIKAVSIENISIENLTLTLPKKAQNISIKTGEEVQVALDEADDYEELINETDRNSLITGQVTGDVSLELKKKQGILTRFWNWLTSAGITGNVISEEESQQHITETNDSKIVDLQGIAETTQETNIGIGYYTDAPIATEENTTTGKLITVSTADELNYTDVLAFTEIPNGTIKNENNDSIKIYHYVWVEEATTEANETQENITERETQEEEISVIEQTNEAGEVVNESVSEIINDNEQITNETQEIVNETSEEIINPRGLITGQVVAEDIEEEQIIESIENKSLIEKTIDEIANESKVSNLILTKVPVDFVAYDLNLDGYVDYIEWIVPHLSNQTYNIVISTTGYTGTAIKDGDYYHLPISTTAPYDSLVGYWSFDGDLENKTGFTANDFSIKGNDGTGINQTVVNTTGCLYDGCAQFDGDGDWIDVTNFPVGVNHSVFMWAKRADNDSVWDGLAHYTNSDYFSVHSTGRWIINTRNSSNSALTCYSNYGLTNHLNWSFVGYTTEWNGTTIIRLTYYNGVSTGCGNLPEANGRVNWLFSGIGARKDTYDNLAWNGSIDEVMVFNTTLTAAQVTAIYQNTSARFVSSGTLNVNQTNLTSQYYTTLDVNSTFKNKFNTNISLALSYYTSGWNLTSAQNITGYNSYTINKIVTNVTFNYTLISDSNSFYTPLLNDSTIILNATYDDTAPDVNLTYPTNTTYDNYVTDLNYTVSDAVGLSSCWYGNGTVNYTIVTAGVNWTGLSGNSSKGSNTWTVWCNDTANNLNSSTVTFSVDSTNPSLNVTTPVNTSWFNSSSVLFNVSSSESGTGMIVPVIDNSLVSWWRMDDINSSGDIVDYMGINNGNKAGGAVQIDSGKFGKGFVFDGVGDAINISYTPSMNSANAYTVSLWAKPNATANPGVWIFYAYGSGSSGLAVRTVSNQWRAWYDLNNANNANTNIGSITAGWQHLAVIFNQSGIWTYKNGLLTTSSTALKGSFNNISNPNYFIGYPGATSTFNGTIDEVMVFNRSLSADEVVSLYNATKLQHRETLADRSHTFKAYTQDLAANINQSNLINFGVDTLFPTVNFSLPTPANASTQSSNSIYVNLTTNDTNQHYSFTDFDRSLVGWWRMDDLNASNDPYDLSSWSNNGSKKGNAAQTDAGYFGKGFVFDGTGDYVAIKPVLLGLQEMTISVWVKEPHSNTAASYYYIIGGDNNSASTEEIMIYSYSTNPGDVGGITIANDYGVSINVGIPSPTNTWHHYAVIYNQTAAQAFEDGVSGGIDTLVTAHTINISRMSFGGRYGGTTQQMNGTIDEVMIFNRSLSAAEISALYNATASQYYNNFTGLGDGSHTFTGYAVDRAGNKNQTEQRSVTVDTGLPSVNVTYPLNTSYSINVSSLNYTHSGASSCWYSNNSGIWNSSIVSAGTNFTNVISIEGSNTWSVYCNDTADNINNTEQRTFVVDTTYPLISVVYPQNASYTTNVTDLNYTVSGASSCWYSLNSGATNTSVTCGTNVTNLTSTEGSNSWTIWANDTANNLNSSSVTFFKDSINPSIAYGAITETSGTIIARNNIIINVTSSDTNLKNITIYLFNSTRNLINSTNSTISPLFVNFTSLSDGIHFFNASAYDSLSNKNVSETRNVTIDVTNPLVSYGTGTAVDYANLSQTSIYINVSVTEANPKNITFYLFNDTNGATLVNETTYSMANQNSNITINFTNLIEDIYYYNVTVRDIAENRNTTETRTITLDITSPSISIAYPVNNTNTTNTQLNVNYTASDSGSGLSSCWWTNNSGLSNHTLANCQTNITGQIWDEGVNTIIVYANDSANNKNSTKVSFILDTTAPNITLLLPADGTSSTTTAYNFTFNVTDTNQVDNCSLIMDVGEVGNLTAITRNVESGIYKSGLSVAAHIWSVNCTDFVNNIGNSTTRTLTVTTPPSGGGATGGGGGSSGAGAASQPITKTTQNVVIDINEINLDIVTASTKERLVRVTNNGKQTETVYIGQKNLDKIVTFSEDSFVLFPGQSKEVKISFIAPEETGIYTGKVFISGKQIPVSININSKELLFDAMIVVPETEKIINIGGKLTAQVTLIPMGEEPRVDVTIHYLIKDFEGKTYVEESETVLVDKQKNFKKEFYTSSLPVGDYVVGLELIYPTGVATSSSHFQIVKKFSLAYLIKENLKLVISLMILGAIILIVSVIAITIRYKKRKRRMLSTAKRLR